MVFENSVLSIIKPDATSRGLEGSITATIQAADFVLLGQSYRVLSAEVAKAFYCEHKNKSFFEEYSKYMSSGPVLIQAWHLVAGDAIDVFRKLIGHTDPKQAASGTIRHTYGISIESNSIHGSADVSSAKREISFFFTGLDIGYMKKLRNIKSPDFD